MTALDAPAVRAGEYRPEAAETEAAPGSFRELRETEEAALDTMSLRLRISNLRDTLARVVEERENARGRASLASRHHAEDLQRLSAAANAEADRRGYCSEWDEISRAIVETLHRSEEWTYRERSYRVDVPVTIVTGVYVNATDEEAAVENARELHSERLEEEAVECLRAGAASIDWSAAEAEEDDG